ncbi:MAG: DsbA family protein, partial [Pseudomonadota bacterium]
MTLEVDLYWSFRSPYSYLATPRLVTLARDWDVEVRVRPVYPLAVRDPEFFSRVDPQWVAYLLRDVHRVAEMEGIPFHWPAPDPIVQDLTTRKIAAEQPLIHRLTRLGVAAVEAGRGLPFIEAVSALIWGGTTGWDAGDHLARATVAAGL